MNLRIEELQEGSKPANEVGFKKFGIGKLLKIFFKQSVFRLNCGLPNAVLAQGWQTQ